MSFVIANPEMLAAAATDLAGIRSAISAATAAAAAPTIQVAAAGADEVSLAISALFGQHAQAYQALSAQATIFHDQFVQALTSGGNLYAAAESHTVEQMVLNAINAPTQTLFGRPPAAGLEASAAGYGATTAPLAPATQLTLPSPCAWKTTFRW